MVYSLGDTCFANGFGHGHGSQVRICTLSTVDAPETQSCCYGASFLVVQARTHQCRIIASGRRLGQGDALEEHGVVARRFCGGRVRRLSGRHLLVVLCTATVFCAGFDNLYVRARPRLWFVRKSLTNIVHAGNVFLRSYHFLAHATLRNSLFKIKPKLDYLNRIVKLVAAKGIDPISAETPCATQQSHKGVLLKEDANV